jgi:hypothetical protein
MSNKIWYKIANSKTPLTQGDIFLKCSVVVPSYKKDLSETNNTLNAKIYEYDVIILSHSCDLINRKVDIVLVSPIFTLTKFCEKDASFNSPKTKERLRQGNYPPYHLLNKPTHKGFIDDYIVVDFHRVLGIPLFFLQQFIKDQKRRLSLISPFREHLSQAFARYFMRVGLPSDIPVFE